jgi:presenilin-like A22 family membrane protease
MLLVLLFLAAQVIGISLLSLNIDGIRTENGRVIIEYGDTALGERPQTEGFQSMLYLLLGVALGTLLVLVLIRYKIFAVWKLWFLLAVWISTSIAFGVLIPAAVAIVLCLGLSIWKVFWPNPIVHNLTEIFMYAGLAVLLVPVFSLLWAAVLLVIISIYDIIAVWHSKHMVVMAQAQTESNLFAGLYIPKGALPVPQKPREHKGRQTSAILGGGDIAFPLLFSGVVMDWLILQGSSKAAALYFTLIVIITTTVALTLLFFYAKKDRFYPAMPFLSAGAFAGFAIVWLLQLL